jgi:hypothetical protein
VCTQGGQEATDLGDRFLAVRALLDADQIHEGINADESDVPRMAGPTDLRLQFARVGASDHNQDRARPRQHALREQLIPVPGDGIQRQPIRISRFDLDHEPIPRGVTPDAIKPHGVRGPLVSAVRDVIFQPPPQFIDEVLQHLSTFGEGIAEAIIRVGGKRIDGNLPQILPQLLLRLRPVSQSAIASRRNNLLDRQLSHGFGTRSDQTEERHLAFPRIAAF